MTLIDKILYSLLSAAIAVLVFNPYTFIAVDKIFGGKHKIADKSGAPTLLGIAINAVIYFIIVLLIMMISNGKKD